MRRQEAVWQAAVSACGSLTILLAGCGGPDLVALRDREVSELRFESERRRQSIVEYLDALEIARQSQGALEAERQALVGEAEALHVSLRAANELARQTAQQRDETRKKLTDAEEANGRLKESLDKVKSVASGSAVELADLRLKRQELESKLQVTTRNEAALREEKRTMATELDEVRAELVRTKAVARSLQEGSAAAQAIAMAAQDDRIRELERQVTGLRGENTALHQRVTSFASTPSDGDPPPAVANLSRPASSEGAHYRNHPAGLLVELQGILKDRYDRARQGQIVWDAFDFCVAGVAALGVLVVFLILLRVVRALRPRAQSPTSASARAEAVVAEPTAASVRQEAVALAAARPGDSMRIRKSPSARRSSFSAVISSRSREAVAVAPEESASAREEEIEPAEARSADLRTVPMAAEPPRAAGGLLRPETDSREAAEGEQANTQIIPKLEQEERATPPRVGSTAVPRSPSVAVPKTAKAPRPEGRSKGGEEKDLLNELKAVINKKFDELIQ